jgi:hypothetical protein
MAVVIAKEGNHAVRRHTPKDSAQKNHHIWGLTATSMGITFAPDF